MAVRFLPYAAKAVVQHVWDTNHLDVWVTFRHPMDQTVKPANGLWLCEVEGVPKNTSASVWQDDWTILLTVDAVATPPDQVTLEYDGPSTLLITTWGKQWEPWGPITSISLPFDWEDIIFIDVVNQRVGILDTPQAFTFEIYSPTLHDFLALYHDDSDAYFRTKDGAFIFLTDESTNTNSQIWIRGKGTGFGLLRIFDENNLRYWQQTCVTGIGYIAVEGTTPILFVIQSGAECPVNIFAGSTEGETQLLGITGFRTGDALRTMIIGVGVHAADTASFYNMSNFYFAGNITALNRIASGAAILAAAGPTDNYDASGINTLFLDCSANNVTIGGFVGGVAGQTLHIARLCAAANNATLEHNEGTGNQDIFLHAGADETLTGEYGGWVLVCNGTHWFDVSHSKHV